MKQQQFASVWDAIEATPAKAENMKLRASLMLALQDRMQASAMTQAQAAKVFGVTKPCISDLMRGKIDLFAIDTIVSDAGHRRSACRNARSRGGAFRQHFGRLRCVCEGL